MKKDWDFLYVVIHYLLVVLLAKNENAGVAERRTDITDLMIDVIDLRQSVLFEVCSGEFFRDGIFRVVL